MFLRVSKYPPNVIFLLMQYKYKTHKRNWLSELAQYKTAYVELALAFLQLFLVIILMGTNNNDKNLKIASEASHLMKSGKTFFKVNLVPWGPRVTCKCNQLNTMTSPCNAHVTYSMKLHNTKPPMKKLAFRSPMLHVAFSSNFNYRISGNSRDYKFSCKNVV